MRCYFHLVDASKIILDGTGVEVSGQEEARAEALAAIAELRQADPAISNAWKGWTLSVVDATGSLLFSMSLQRRWPFAGLSLHCLIAAMSAQTLQPLTDVILLIVPS
jgi:hypothetical protein